MTAITVGCDPEFFLYDTQNNMFVSAHDKVPGTKNAPYKLDCGAVQADGTAVEFNTDPASSPVEFVDNIGAVLRQIREMIPKRYNFYYTPVVIYEKEYFKYDIPASAKELGCDPDYNIYRDDTQSFDGSNINPRPVPTIKEMRTGAGHLHVGWGNNIDILSKDHQYDCYTLVKGLDRTIGLRTNHWDNDRLRQNLYGRLGTYRPKPYGVEYRTPSNAWLNYPELWPILFRSINTTFNAIQDGRKKNID